MQFKASVQHQEIDGLQDQSVNPFEFLLQPLLVAFFLQQAGVIEDG